MTVATMRTSLTQDDIRRLVRGDSTEDRAQATQKLCRQIAGRELSDADRDSAYEILAMLASDAATLVRRTLAVTLKNSPNLPREIALKLAQDVEAVAVPILKNSPVFTDTDLVDILLASSPEKQVAIAERETLSEDVTEVIALYGHKSAVEAAALRSNPPHRRQCRRACGRSSTQVYRQRSGHSHTECAGSAPRGTRCQGSPGSDCGATRSSR